MSRRPTGSLGENSSQPTRLLAAIRSRAAGVCAILVVLAVVALPHPLPDLAPGLFVLVGIAEGVGLAVAAENLLRRPATGFDLGRASKRVAGVAGASAAFVVAMAALGVDLGPRDRALLAGVCLSGPAAIVVIDYLKARTRADLWR
ncbi:hypothetical protein [Halorussus litoreus]|uniref:hypothetical protein n=1 Tax=Halorussus litoreus TaxID=1710536 RepID=UPI000E24C6CA|nr:hypothetical protein [Halorussus litoreus]